MRCEASVFYVCPHNPSRDLHIKHVLTEVKKSRNRICVIVVLLVFENFVEALRHPSRAHLYQNKSDVGDMHSIADFLAWLAMFQCGLFAEWRILIPYADASSLVEDRLWMQLQTQWGMEMR